MNEPDFYLASTENAELTMPRRCWSIKRLATDSRDDLLLAKIDPPLLGQRYGLGEQDIDYVLLAPRHKGGSLFPINEWPLYVHVARLLIKDVQMHKKLDTGEFELIAWAELYKTEKDAELKVI